MTTVAGRLDAAATMAEAASAIARQWANGPENTTVSTESGPLPTLAEFMRQNAAGLFDTVKASELSEENSSVAIAGVEAFLLIDGLCPESYGAIPGEDATAAVIACYADCYAKKKPFLHKSEYLISDTINIPVGVKTIASGAHFKCIGSNFADGRAAIKLGDQATDVRWIGAAGTLMVDCNATNAIGIEFGRTWQGCDVDYAKVIGHNNVGIKHTSGYGLQLKSSTIWAISKRDGYADNASFSSIGLLVTTTDSYYGPCQVFGSFVGIKAIKGFNHFNNPHCWSTYKKSNGDVLACPMGIPIWNLGQSNLWTKPIADSPSMIDYNQPASETNGGYGIYNRTDGFQACFVGGMVFIPNRSASDEVVPVGKIQAYKCNQAATYIGCEKFDDSPGKLAFTAETFEGGNMDLCHIVGRDGFSVYTVDFPRFRRRVVAAKGLDIQTTYDDVDSTVNNFGVMNFKQTDRHWLRINANYEGTTLQIKLERLQKGNTGDRDFLATILGASDEGYEFWLTDLKKKIVWGGAAWYNVNGGLA